MKTFISMLIVLLTFSLAYGQEVASVKSASDVISIKEKGKGFIVLPSKLNKEDVMSKAKYYTLYFTVDFDERSKIATISMVDNTERSRAIIVRFLAACEVQTINVAGEVMDRGQLFERYLK
jgi:hypothetical protein